MGIKWKLSLGFPNWTSKSGLVKVDGGRIRDILTLARDVAPSKKV